MVVSCTRLSGLYFENQTESLNSRRINGPSFEMSPFHFSAKNCLGTTPPLEAWVISGQLTPPGSRPSGLFFAVLTKLVAHISFSGVPFRCLGMKCQSSRRSWSIAITLTAICSGVNEAFARLMASKATDELGDEDPFYLLRQTPSNLARRSC